MPLYLNVMSTALRDKCIEKLEKRLRNVGVWQRNPNFNNPTRPYNIRKKSETEDTCLKCLQNG